MGKTIQYDLKSLPYGYTEEDINELIEKENVCFWDSRKGGDCPTFIEVSDRNIDYTNVEIVDIAKV